MKLLTVDPATIARRRHYPSISLLVHLDGTPSWHQRLDALHRQAQQRLRDEFGAGVDRALLARLDAAVGAATPPPRTRSLAIYVDDQSTFVVPLDVVVTDRAVIDDTFATRDLVVQDHRAVACWVLALELDDPRFYQARGPRLDRVPLVLRDTAEHPSMDGGSRRRRDVREVQRTRRLRAIDQAIGEHLAEDQDALLVVGPEPTISQFLGLTRHRRRVEGTIRRAAARDVAALRSTVAGAVDTVLRCRAELAVARLEGAVDRGTAASGLGPVWRAAHRDAGGVLLVEQHYHQAVRVLPDGSVVPVDDPAAPTVVDDAIDDLIETVLAGRGQVEIVPDGRLDAHQRVAYLPVHRRRR